MEMSGIKSWLPGFHLTFDSESVMTEIFVASEPVPAVVGTAINVSLCDTLSEYRFFKVISLFLVSAEVAFARSIELPPPIAIIASALLLLAAAILEVKWFVRSEEHTSELQSRFDLVCRLLL